MMINKTPLRIGFAGTPEFALTALQAIDSSFGKPVVVYTQPDRPAGRGRQIQQSPVKQYAISQAIPVLQPISLKPQDTWIEFSKFSLDILIVVAYGQLLPAPFLTIPRFGCWNIHASLLPKWRGAAPIQRSIEAGDLETGITIMQMDKGLDTGDILLQKSIRLSCSDTAQSLHDSLANLGANAVIEALKHIRSIQNTAQAQDDSHASYAHKLSKQEAEIDWSLTSKQIAQKIRAFNSWPVARVNSSNGTLRLWAATSIEKGHSLTPGTLLNSDSKYLEIACSSGVLRILELQKPGGKRLSARDYLNSNASKHRLGELF